MPWDLQTKDGIVLKNIPDEVSADDPTLKARVAKIRADVADGTVKPDATKADGLIPPGQTPQALASQDLTPQFFEGMTPEGSMGAVARGGAPYAAAALAGAGAGLFAGGVGAGPGAVAGVGIMGLAQLLGDPLVDAVNYAFPGANVTRPTEAMNHVLTMAGVAQPGNGFERTLQTGASGAASASGLAAAGQSMAQFVPGLRGIGTALADKPVTQAASGLAGGVAGQVAGEAGLPPWLQTLSALGAGGAVALPGAMRAPAQVKPQAFNPTEGVVPAASMTDVGALAAQAAGKGAAADAAKQRLAAEAKVNPEALAAAKRLGFDLPPDVYSDSPQVRAAAGLNRSIKVSDAAADWHNTVSTAVDHADRLIQNLDALYVNGGPSLDVANQQVKNALTTTRDGVEATARELYDRIREAVPLATPASADNLRAFLDQRVKDLGGTEGLSSVEKKLYRMVYTTDDNGNLVMQDPTYGRLQEEKQILGKQAYSGSDPYPDAADKLKKDLYAEIGKDQTATVDAVADPETKDMMEQANKLWGQKKALDDRMVALFGNDQVNGSLASKLQAALSAGAKKNDSTAFMQVFQSIPDDLKKPVVATAIASVTRSARGAEAGGFGFSEFAKTYDGLRTNPTVYNAVVKALGDGSDQFLRDLYTVSRRITDARAQVTQTGASMQAYMQGINPDNLMGTLLKALVKQGATAAGASAMGPAGAVGASVVSDSLLNGTKKGLETAGNLFRDPKFQAMLLDPEKAAAVASSPQYRAFAKYAGLPREVRGAITFFKGLLVGADVGTYQTTSPAASPEASSAKSIPIRERVRAAQKTGGK